MATTTATTAPTPPKIGSLTSSGKPWTGGTPDVDWTKSSRPTPMSAYCLRDPENMKLLKVRISSFDKTSFVFHRNDKKISLKFFADEVLWHIKMTGMDSIFHVPDPLEPTTMINIVVHHSRVSLQQVSDFINKLTNETDPSKPSYDLFDLENLNDSWSYLESMLDVDLRKAIRASANESTTGPEIWMRIVSEVQSASLDQLRAIELHIREKCIPTNYPNKNIKLLVQDIRESCYELDLADELPKDIVSIIVNNFTKSTVRPFELYFFNRRTDVLKFLKNTRGKSKAFIAASPDKITYSDLCNEAQEQYQSLLETKMWPPAATSGDKGDAPQALVAKLLKLAQESTKSTSPSSGQSVSNNSDVCRYCKKVGHTKENCLKLKRKNAKDNQSNPTLPVTTATTNPSAKLDQANDNNWKTTPPSKNSPLTITKEGKEWHWCAKCSSWRISHGTDGHKSNEELASQRTQQANVATPSLSPSDGPGMHGW
jgi:hypothetical protein